jgi:hypothetical protein
VNKGEFALWEVLTVRITREFWNSILSSMTVSRTSKACINGPDEHIDSSRELVESLDESHTSSPVRQPLEEAVFICQGDYWTLRYQGQTAILKARSEMDVIAEQLAAAVGLAGRDRPSSSEAERARSAVTRRIKEAIKRIAEVVPPLGRHLAVRIKTGYFCSYNPHPDRPIAWKF